MTIKVYTNIQECTGLGEEWLLTKDGDVIAVFIDGNFRKDPEKGNNDNTLASN